MRSPLLPAILFALLYGSLLAPFAAGAQKITYYDSLGHRVKEWDAWLLKEEVKIDDSRWEFNTYRMKGPRLLSIQTIDEDGLTLNGRYIHYDAKGQCDTVGNYINGHKEGHWFIYSPRGRIISQLNYHTDTLVELYDTALFTRTFTRVEIEASFPGGTKAWLTFLNRTMRYPDFAFSRGISGTTAVTFIVMTDGSINQNEVYISRSSEYSLDREARRIIHQSPSWVPAVQHGRQIIAYMTQPIMFLDRR